MGLGREAIFFLERGITFTLRVVFALLFLLSFFSLIFRFFLKAFHALISISFAFLYTALLD